MKTSAKYIKAVYTTPGVIFPARPKTEKASGDSDDKVSFEQKGSTPPPTTPREKHEREKKDSEKNPVLTRGHTSMEEARKKAASEERTVYMNKSEIAKIATDDYWDGGIEVCEVPGRISLPNTLPAYKHKILTSLIDNQFDREIFNQRRGKLDFNALYKAHTGSDRVFKLKEENKNKKYAMGFLYDKSGSMIGDSESHIVDTIYVLHYLFSGVPGIEFYEAWYSDDFRMMSAPHRITNPNRSVALYLNYLHGSDDEKTYGVQINGQPLSWTRKHVYGCYDGENNEHEAIPAFGHHLAMSDAQRKFMFVFSDGGAFSPVAIEEQIKIQKKNGIDVVGVGIGHANEIKDVFPNNCEAYNAGDLPAVLLEKITSLIKRG